jgi:AbrB family looped-hinge helix DNA binding protein
MKTTRKIDDVGRIVIPKAMRSTFEIQEGDELELIQMDNGILIKPIAKEANPIDEIMSVVEKFAADAQTEAKILNMLKEIF